MKYDKTMKPQRGFRAEVNILHDLSTILERNPWMPRPRLELGYSEHSQPTVIVNIFSPVHGAEGDTQLARMKDSFRAVRRAFGVSRWSKNDPGNNDFAALYYELEAEWRGAIVKISSPRDKVCQLIVREEEYTEEIPDPAFEVPEVPSVTVTRTRQIREWKCNEASAVHPNDAPAELGVALRVRQR